MEEDLGGWIIKILGYTYSIKRIGTMDEIGSSGRADIAKQVIQIATDLTSEQTMSTVLHEILEALKYYLELEMEHSVIMALEAGLYQVLVDNGVDLSPLLEGR